MKKKEFLYLLLCFVLLGVSLTSCNDDDDSEIDDPVEVTRGAYVLSSGSWGYNNSVLDYYDLKTGEVNSGIFYATNDRKLGDTANDLLVYGSKLYIAVNVSNTIEVTDLNGKSIKQIQPENNGSSIAGPRYLTAEDGKVYVTLYDGYLAQIDTTTLEIEKKVEVGVGVEQVCESNDKLYVVISSNPTASTKVKEIDIKTFTVTKEIDAVINPCYIKADDAGYLYVISSGESPDYSNKLVRVNPTTGETVELLAKGKIAMTEMDDYLYIIASDVENWAPVNPQYLKYNMDTQQFETTQFVNSDVTVEQPMSLNVDPVSGDVYITSGTYTATGDVHIISKDGALVKTVALSGINPICTRFVTTEE
ncbi:MAG: hypothetical protein PHG27_01125 [Massilibacteroides sp.]|nr:hypothetical protein [Massilibacteroides sp.]MDD3063035.1 hypothetical protein [Massilibacteroides sp.]MDD4114188.1 hypothetical protein [Massilibacteroides sp.]MDD4660544.1 hypothetical protein [Massilibacteroides sp.]